MDPRQTAETFNAVQPFLFWIVALATGFCAVATVIAQNIVRAATWLLFTLAGTSAVFFLLGADLVGATQLLVYVGGTLVLVIFGVMLTAQGPFVSMKSSGAEWAISVVAGFLLMAVLATAVLTPAVTMGPPLVRTVGRFEAGPKKGEKHVIYRTPEVRRFAPEFSRAERQVLAARQPATGAPQNIANKYQKAEDKGGKGAAKGGGAGKQLKPPVPGKKDGGAPPDVDNLSTQPTVERPAPLEPATSAQSATLGQGFIGVPLGPAHPVGATIARTSYLLPFEIVSVHLLVVLVGAAYLARAKRRRGGVS